MTFRGSLRDIEACLEAQTGLAYHLGFRARITRSTLARANEARDWHPVAALAQKLMPRVRALYRDEPNAIELEAPIYAVDSTLIDLSLALCPWANWTGGAAAVKLQGRARSARPVAGVSQCQPGHPGRRALAR